jgi:NADH-ubiquinone oxidoreductase chain 4
MTDKFSVVFLRLCIVVFILTVVLDQENIPNSNFPTESTILIVIITIRVTARFIINSMIGFFLLFERSFILIFSYLLYYSKTIERQVASLYLILFTLVTSMPLIIRFVGVLWQTGANSILGGKTFNQRNFWWFLLFMVFLVKLPVYGVHSWLPKAHVEATLSGSVLLSGILLKIGAYGLIRFVNIVGFLTLKFNCYMFSIGLIGRIITALLTFRQLDIKKIVAYSSIVHIGILFFSIITSITMGLDSSLLMSYSHGVTSPMIFFIVYVAYFFNFTRNILISKGIGSLFPKVILSYFIVIVFSLGAPPRMGFFSEILGFSSLMLFFPAIFFLSVCLLFISGLYIFFFFTHPSHGSRELSANVERQ